MSPIILGCDPGKAGGLVAIRDGGEVVASSPMPLRKANNVSEINPEGIFAFLETLPYAPALTVIERVGGRPGESVNAVFNFGFGTGILYGLVRARGWEVSRPWPQTWKAALFPNTPPGERGKEVAILYAEHNYPSLNLLPGSKRKPHDGLADAVCLASYGLMHLSGELD